MEPGDGDGFEEEVIDHQNLIRRNGGRQRIPFILHLIFNMNRGNMANQGLTEGQFDRIPTRVFVVDPDTPELEVEKCTICFENLKDQEVVKELPCSHLFHPECVKTWLLRNKKCPVCKADADAPET